MNSIRKSLAGIAAAAAIFAAAPVWQASAAECIAPADPGQTGL